MLAVDEFVVVVVEGEAVGVVAEVSVCVHTTMTRFGIKKKFRIQINMTNHRCGSLETKSVTTISLQSNMTVAVGIKTEEKEASKATLSVQKLSFKQSLETDKKQMLKFKTVQDTLAA